jgi:hypothetical protein
MDWTPQEPAEPPTPTLRKLERPAQFYRILKQYGKLPLPLLITMAGHQPIEFVNSIKALRDAGFIELNDADAVTELYAIAEDVEATRFNRGTDELIYTFTRRARQQWLTANCMVQALK